MIDLLVVGGGPIGLATALTANRAGLSVTLMEPRSGPIDKACGEGLMPGALAALSALGVSVEGHQLTGIRYLDATRSVDALFTDGLGRGVRRTTLHASLRRLVEQADISLVPEPLDPSTIEQAADHVLAGGLAARYLAAADGLHSPVRRALGLDRPAAQHPRFGLRQHYVVRPWTDLVEVHWARDREAYVTPVSDDLVGVAILTSERGPFESQLRHFPQLLARLPAQAATSTRGAGPLRQRSKARVSGRVLLVGDAAGYVDALTGEGIAVGLAAARALVDCVACDRPEDYESRWREASRRYRWITGSLLWARNQRVLGQAIVPAARRLPRVFAVAVDQLAR